MSALSNKTILLISPQSWGKMFLSKHHYAIELAKKGNRVFFLSPPEKELSNSILIESVAHIEGLYIIRHKINFPYNIKFHAIGLFHWLMERQIKKILKQLKEPIDIVWSFDLGYLYPFKFFPRKALKIFHPVDEPVNEIAISSASGADIILSVTREILDKYKLYKIPGYFINHGISNSFLQQSFLEKSLSNPISVGFSGNLLRSDIDRPIFLQIIKNHPEIIFECWGSFKLNQANIGGNSDRETEEFIEALKKFPNVILHGAVSTEILAKEFQRMDAFLICYDIQKDQSGGTNYHKVMEYLSAGKVIISNNISTYKDQPDLISMTESRTSNDKLPDLFKHIVNHLFDFNANSLVQKRKDFAFANAYDKQLNKIEEILSNPLLIQSENETH